MQHQPTHTLAIDIETYSGTDIKAGVHRYVEDPDFEILLIAFSFDGSPVEVLDIGSGADSDTESGALTDVVAMLRNPAILKTAYNAAFEIACFSKWLGVPLDAEQWSCTMALGAQAGLPLGLDAAAAAAGAEVRKDVKGKALIRYFAQPCKPTKANGGRTRNLPYHDFSAWLDFIEYCRRDVEVEQALRSTLGWFKPAEFERPMWALDHRINTRGVAVDMALVGGAIALDEHLTAEAMGTLRELTGLENPGSDAQIKRWLMDSCGEYVHSLAKEHMPALHERLSGTLAGDVLRLRELISRAATAKYYTIAETAGADHRVRGLFMYYGAARTGRWAGRSVQVQNLRRNTLTGPELDAARELVRERDLEALRLLYADPGDVIADIVRTAFVAREGHVLISCDLSAIEARVIAWLAGEQWRLDVFNSHGKIYEASAAMMMRKPIEEVTKAERQRGKVAELALGYQGGIGALEAMGGKAIGLSEDDMRKVVREWRAASPAIVRLWASVEDAAFEAMQGAVAKVGAVRFFYNGKHLECRLPSGRALIYRDAQLRMGKLSYMGVDQCTRKWQRVSTYGGKLVENIVQAIARDVLAVGLRRAELDAALAVVMHVHDEIVVEVPEAEAERAANVLECAMTADISWAKGLPLKAEAFVSKYYQK